MNGVDWALVQDLNAPKKLLLVALVWLADDDGVTIKAQTTIAARLGKDTRWLREHLPGLAADGFVTRYRRHRMNGSRTSDLLVINWPRTEALDLENYSGIVGDREPGDREPTGGNSPGGQPAGSRQPTGENPPDQNKPLDKPATGRKEARAGAPDDAFPDDLPAELLEPALAAGKILKAVALRRGQTKAVTRAAVGHAVLSLPDRDHVKVARDVEFWLEHGNGARKTCRDIVARYRAFLDSSEPRPGPPLPGAPRRAAESSTGPARMRQMAADLRNAG
jgi:hypothetical protein